MSASGIRFLNPYAKNAKYVLHLELDFHNRVSIIIVVSIIVEIDTILIVFSGLRKI